MMSTADQYLTVTEMQERFARVPEGTPAVGVCEFCTTEGVLEFRGDGTGSSFRWWVCKDC